MKKRNPKRENTTNRNRRIALGVIVSIILLIIVFYWLSYFFENTLYEPFDNWYRGGVWISNSDCLKAHSYYFQIDERKDTTYTSLSLESSCKNDFNIILESPTVKSFTVEGDKKLIKSSKITNSSEVFLTIDNDKAKKRLSFSLIIETKNQFDFYSHYDFQNTPIADSQQIDFIYNGKKYVCEAGCIAIVHGNIEQELPILNRENFIRAKNIRWSDRRLLFIFAPQRLNTILHMKLVTGAFIGLLATLLYFLIFRVILKIDKLN